MSLLDIIIIFVLVIAWVAVKFGINTTSVVLEMVIFTHIRMLYISIATYAICSAGHHYFCTSNSMGSSEIWDKYHECCIGNGKFDSYTHVVH